MRKFIFAFAILLTLLTVNAYAEAPKIIMNGEYVMQADAIDITDPPPINNVSNALDVLDDALDANGRKLEYLGEFKLTYYCPCRKCNGGPGIDRFGNPLEWGTIAVDPKVIPLHTKVVIDGYDAVFTALDTGGKWVQGNHIDVFVPVSHSEALKMPHGERRKVWRYDTN